MLYSEFIEKVSKGIKWKIDLKNKVCKVDGDVVDIQADLDETDVKSMLNTLYKNYKYSYPSERSERYADKNYFKALSSAEMTDEELALGSDRNVARACLEGAVLLLSLKGKLLELFTNDKQWFWKGENGLIILKEWC